MVGMGSVVTRHVPPLAKAFGSPAVVRGINSMKFDYFDLSEIDIENFQTTYSNGELPAKNELSATALGIYEEFESIVQGQESSY
jgi:UDP-N-acetylglucosamine acyltransferase